MRARLPALWATPMVAPCSFAGVRLESKPNTGARVRLEPTASNASTSSILIHGQSARRNTASHFNWPSPLMNGSSVRLMPVSTRLKAISFGSPSRFTSRPITPPWMNTAMIPQKTKTETTVMAGLVSSTVMPRLKLSFTSNGRVVSKQLKAKVARKKIRISMPIFGWASVCPHCFNRGRLLAWQDDG